jgi:dihydrolipoamide dehydrogenase|tara:strand:- start:666 stop:2075 length:1410 start_codon:yes stop_codon:yes gene_type:complete
MTNPKHLIVVGGGVGGYTAAIRAARHGLQVTLVEGGELGGTCLNVGCIPTKSLLHNSAAIRGLPYTSALAARKNNVENSRNVLANLIREKSKSVEKLVSGVQMLLRRNKITHVSGKAVFTGPKTLKIVGTDKTIAGDVIVIATGSVVTLPPISKIDIKEVITSDDAINLVELPDSIAIMGGGAIGVEFAQIFANLGAEVTLLEMADRILSDEDPEATNLIAKTLSAQGVTIRTGVKVSRISKVKGGVILDLEGCDNNIKADKVLLATGRKPNIEGLGLAAAGIEMHEGAIKVDDHLRTNVSGVYAVGDVTGGPLLAHRAAAQAECAVGHYLGHNVPPMSTLAMPRAVYTQPELASVGLTEEQAQAQGDIKVGRFPFSANGRAVVIGKPSGFVKIIADARHEQILGIVMVGPDASNLLGEATIAVQMELTLSVLMYTIHAHPTLSEALVEAAHDAHDGGAIHQPPTLQAS